MPHSVTTGKKIFFYDGSCGMCSRLIQFFHRKDRYNRILFAPFDGETFAELTRTSRKFIQPANDRSYFYDGIQIVSGADAVLSAMANLDSWTKILGVLGLRFRPAALKNIIYNMIASRRLWLSRILFRSSCSLPSQGLLQKMLP